MPKRKRKGVYVPVPKGFHVSTPYGHLKGEPFDWKPDAIYITFDDARAQMHYAGEKAGESGIQFDIPASPDFLRDLAKKLTEKADALDRGEI